MHKTAQRVALDNRTEAAAFLCSARGVNDVAASGGERHGNVNAPRKVRAINGIWVRFTPNKRNEPDWVD